MKKSFLSFSLIINLTVSFYHKDAFLETMSTLGDDNLNTALPKVNYLFFVMWIIYSRIDMVFV